MIAMGTIFTGGCYHAFETSWHVVLSLPKTQNDLVKSTNTSLNAVPLDFVFLLLPFVSDRHQRLLCLCYALLDGRPDHNEEEEPMSIGLALPSQTR